MTLYHPWRHCAATLALACTAFTSQAEITIGAVLTMTGPTSALGIPSHNNIKQWPTEIAGEPIRIVVLDDATDPTMAVRNTRRLVSEEKADVIVGSVATPIALAMADVARESGTPQLALSPVPMAAGSDTWTFRLAHSSDVMAEAMLAHMQRQGVRTLGFLGYTDAYGEAWLKAIQAQAEAAGIKLVATERFQRTDANVVGQTLKLLASKPDAILIVASGSGAAMPQRAVVERGYQGKVYQTHGAASQDLLRLGGKAAEGAYVVSGPVMVAEQLPAEHPSRPVALAHVQQYEQSYGEQSRSQFAAQTHDAFLVLEQAIPLALQKARPGTPEFRAALRDALENMPAMPGTQGVIDFSANDHWGRTAKDPVIMKVVNGAWALEQD